MAHFAQDCQTQQCCKVNEIFVCVCVWRILRRTAKYSNAVKLMKYLCVCVWRILRRTAKHSNAVKLMKYVCVCVWRILRRTATHFCSHRHKLSPSSVLPIWVAELIENCHFDVHCVNGTANLQ